MSIKLLQSYKSSSKEQRNQQKAQTEKGNVPNCKVSQFFCWLNLPGDGDELFLHSRCGPLGAKRQAPFRPSSSWHPLTGTWRVASEGRGLSLHSSLFGRATARGLKFCSELKLLSVDCCCQRCREWTLKIERPRSAWREEAKRLEIKRLPVG